ncbi:helix-turn-helix domain-containing protein [Paenibacillus alginolyticus]|uniref:helix-turn-helix domain-containing protein n=1 Tax=Paenibacillus alginolyticus TaxID=59839 RepID=UPI0013E2971F|nr:helix-turn-helix transcriptional regulator [Paenibacillus alginolyticus]MCY9664459.1 helix-turn-helix domain-containing protein [Paenibacillus alginolyticus]
MLTIGTQLVKLRHSRSLTQYQLSDKTGLTRAAISHYEKNRREPDINTLILLADFFKVSLDELVGRTEEWSDIESIG